MPLRDLPTSREMEDWVLVAVQRLGGNVYYKDIDDKVRELLVSDRVSKRATQRKIKSFRITSHNNKSALARTGLSRQGLLVRATERGYWRLTSRGKREARRLVRDKTPQIRISETRTRGNLGSHFKSSAQGGARASTVNGLARRAGIKRDAVKFLRDNNVPENVIEKFLELLADRLLPSTEVSPDTLSYEARMDVERKAIAFIQQNEPEWHGTPANNPGFDLYQTDDGTPNGQITQWCEVKSLSGKFGPNQPVQLTSTEFEKAQECSRAYWLYIIQNATSDNPAMIKIQDPASKARGFIFGQRWRDFAEKL